MKKRVAGFALIFLGIAISLYLLVLYGHAAYLHWQTIDSFKVEEFSDFWKYYWNFCKGDFVGSLAVGAVPAGVGVCLLRVSHAA